MSGDPKFEGSQSVPDFPYARYAELLGFQGLTVDQPGDVGPAWDEALRADRPVVLEVYTDPEVPPMPPHLKFEQAKSYLAALRKGDPEALGMIRASTRDFLAQWWPKRD